MMITCSMSGVPRTIQTIIFTNMRSGVNFDMEPNDIRRPSGMERANVSANKRSVV